MCCTGRCLYENHEGDCTRPWEGVGTVLPVYPDDAYCVLMEKAQELDAAGLLGDIDVDDTEKIVAAYREYVERGQEIAAEEEALGELDGFVPTEHDARGDSWPSSIARACVNAAPGDTILLRSQWQVALAKICLKHLGTQSVHLVVKEST